MLVRSGAGVSLVTSMSKRVRFADDEVTIGVELGGGMAPSLSGTDRSDDDSALHSDRENLDKAMEAAGANYDIDPVLLTFKEPSMEKAFLQHTVETNSYGPGKIYSFIAIGVSAAVFFLQHRTDNSREGWKIGPSKEQLHDAYWLLLMGFVVYGTILFALMFFEKFVSYREVLFLAVLSGHWPTFSAMEIARKAPAGNAYAYCTGCFFFCALVAQPRFIGCFFFLLVTPMLTFFIVTFAGETDYWATHTKLEMIYWIMPVFPTLMLRVYEKRSRTAFVEAFQNRVAMEIMEKRSLITKKLIANFFPQTATLNFLTSRGSEKYFLYPQTCLIVTDVSNFTAWSASTAPELVIETVGKMFAAVDRLAIKFGIEKISTVGDSYFGATFPLTETPADIMDNSGMDQGQRQGKDVTALSAHAMLQFACELARHKHMLPARVGVHIGHTLGGFVGIEPPKFDLFGPAVSHCQMMERTGRTRVVHASKEVLIEAERFGLPKLGASIEEGTEHGLLFTDWEPRSAALADLHLRYRTDEDSASEERRSVSKASDGRSVRSDVRSALSATERVSCYKDKNSVVHVDSARVDLDVLRRQRDERQEIIVENALELCAIVEDFGQKQKSRAMSGVETRQVQMHARFRRPQVGRPSISYNLGSRTYIL